MDEAPGFLRQRQQAGEGSQHRYEFRTHAAAHRARRHQCLHLVVLAVQLDQRASASVPGTGLGGAVRPDGAVWINCGYGLKGGGFPHGRRVVSSGGVRERERRKETASVRLVHGGWSGTSTSGSRGGPPGPSGVRRRAAGKRCQRRDHGSRLRPVSAAEQLESGVRVGAKAAASVWCPPPDSWRAVSAAGSRRPPPSGVRRRAAGRRGWLARPRVAVSARQLSSSVDLMLERRKPGMRFEPSIFEHQRSEWSAMKWTFKCWHISWNILF